MVQSFWSKWQGRRKFIRDILLLGSAMSLAGPACKPADTLNGPGQGPAGYSFGTGDIAVLNFLFMLEQFSAGFYSHINAKLYTGAAKDEMMLLSNIAVHEICHREFFKTALGSNALPDLVLDFGSIDFTNRTTVLTAAIQFEDLGVKAATAAAASIQSAAFVTIAAQIISVECRHATYVHELLSPGSFTGASLMTPSSLEALVRPAQAFSRLSPFIRTKLDQSALQTL